MSWQMTTGRAWPEELVSGEYPQRGQNAVDENNRVASLLEQGWEPFAVSPEPESTQVWFRRETSYQEREHHA